MSSVMHATTGQLDMGRLGLLTTHSTRNQRVSERPDNLTCPKRIQERLVLIQSHQERHEGSRQP